MKSISILLKDKTDTELLETMVSAMAHDDDKLLNKLLPINNGNLGNESQANATIIEAICNLIHDRMDKNETATEAE